MTWSGVLGELIGAGVGFGIAVLIVVLVGRSRK
jgi:hypothetical protein